MDTPTLHSSLEACYDYADWIIRQSAADYSDIQRVNPGEHADRISERLMQRITDHIGHPSHASAVLCTATIEEYAIACSMTFGLAPNQELDSATLAQLIDKHKSLNMGMYLMILAASIVIQRLDANNKENSNG